MFRRGAGFGLAMHGISHHRPLETAVGLGLMLSGGGNSGHHKKKKSHRHHRHVETQAEKNTRLEREALARQRYIEEQERMAERARIIRQQQDKEEEARVQVFLNHCKFISKVKDIKPQDLCSEIQSLEMLTQPINLFSDTPLQGLPEEKGENLFKFILTSDYSTEIQIQALNMLFNRGYSYSYLLKDPLAGSLLTMNQSFDKTIYELYCKNIHDYGVNSLEKHIEEKIWLRLAKAKENYLELIFDNFLKSSNLQNKFHFSTLWINSLDSIQEVMAISKLLLEKMSDNNSLVSMLEKVADQRVLTLEVAKVSAVEKEEKTSNAKPVKDAAITQFLASHHSSLCCFCSKTAAEKTYDKIVKKKFDEAKKEIDKQRENVNKEFDDYRSNNSYY